jgi:hypothetical protein
MATSFQASGTPWVKAGEGVPGEGGEGVKGLVLQGKVSGEGVPGKVSKDLYRHFAPDESSDTLSGIYVQGLKPDASDTSTRAS